MKTVGEIAYLWIGAPAEKYVPFRLLRAAGSRNGGSNPPWLIRVQQSTSLKKLLTARERPNSKSAFNNLLGKLKGQILTTSNQGEVSWTEHQS